MSQLELRHKDRNSKAYCCCFWKYIYIYSFKLKRLPHSYYDKKKTMKTSLAVFKMSFACYDCHWLKLCGHSYLDVFMLTMITQNHIFVLGRMANIASSSVGKPLNDYAMENQNVALHEGWHIYSFHTRPLRGTQIITADFLRNWERNIFGWTMAKDITHIHAATSETNRRIISMGLEVRAWWKPNILFCYRKIFGV